MPIARMGDHVQVHYVKRYQDGSVATTHRQPPLAVIVGVEHPRLPGLGLALVGLVPGSKTTVHVPSERAYDPARVLRLSRARFPSKQPLLIGKWLRIETKGGGQRLVRIMEVRDETVIVDANHRGAGQPLELEVELVDIDSQPSDTKVTK